MNCFLENIIVDLNISLFQILTLVIASITAIVGLFTYRKNTKWKKAEYVASLVNKMKDNRNFVRATLMLDWSKTTIPVYPNEFEDTNIKSFDFESYMLINALNKPILEFDEKEALIRLIFDELFECFETINTHIDKKLYTTKDIDTYIIYWINKLANKKEWEHNPEVKIAIDTFLNQYNYKGVIKLCNKLLNKK
ncbi:hypothetical protein CLV62_13533 [Dysgonomonas alginatilytica]|uniref:Uncharacterized protein n=1 Tax=Dysgonomonas alginatilytica TaxID=1605892 RepID=A0A2V3PLF7_9BACT|nr:hypothetical protein [Dysgonomonas alginatilytica]PXV59461.1 hypothetical protein CLV62_13533 [Dysgonomonas alginatilytica]